jgi:hypothetical protein
VSIDAKFRGFQPARLLQKGSGIPPNNAARSSAMNMKKNETKQLKVRTAIKAGGMGNTNHNRTIA